jgi:hypothetical protein
MEDSTWEGWTTPPQQPAGFELGYPEGRMLPSPPAVGWQGEVRASTKATDDAVKYASRTWTQARPEEFERDGREGRVPSANSYSLDVPTDRQPRRRRKA